MLTLSALALFAGCTEEDTTAEYAGGSFTITIEDVQDLCYDGTFSVIFMPEGTPTDFANPVDLPALEDLPVNATLTLQAPFSDMPVTWDAGEGADQLVIVDAAQTGVLLDADTYGDCTVDMNVNATVDILDADTITGSATLTTSGFDHADCPPIDSDPCDITLVLSGVNTAAATE